MKYTIKGEIHHPSKKEPKIVIQGRKPKAGEVPIIVWGANEQIKEPEQNVPFPRKINKFDYLDGKSDFLTFKTFFIPAKHDIRFREALEKLFFMPGKTDISIRSKDGDINIIFDIRPKELYVYCECFDQSSLHLFNMLCNWIEKWTDVPEAIEAVTPKTPDLPKWKSIVPNKGYDWVMLEMWDNNYTNSEIGTRVGKAHLTITNRICLLRKRYPEAGIPMNEERKKQLYKL